MNSQNVKVGDLGQIHSAAYPALAGVVAQVKTVNDAGVVVKLLSGDRAGKVMGFAFAEFEKAIFASDRRKTPTATEQSQAVAIVEGIARIFRDNLGFSRSMEGFVSRIELSNYGTNPDYQKIFDEAIKTRC